MSAVSVRAAGLDALRRRLAGLPDAARAAVAPGFDALAAEAADAVRSSLGAAPGDPSGRLAAAVSAGPTEAGSAVTVASPEAASLEYGTVRRVAHPFLRPAALRVGRSGLDVLKAALRAGLRR